MFNVSVGVITAPREVCLVDNSLDTLMDQGIPTPHIFAEPGARVHRSQVVIHYNSVKLGCAYNWMNAAQWLLDNTPNDYILLAEDDVQWSRDSLKMMWDVRHLGVISGWTADVNATFGVTGWYPHQNMEFSGMCGSLALLISRDNLIKILSNDNLTKPDRIHLDTDIGFACRALGIPTLCHMPSLVTHLGKGYSTFYKLTKEMERTVDARRCYATCRSRR